MDYSFDWLKAADPHLYDQARSTLDQPLDISIRINTLKADPESAIQKWSRRYGWQTQVVPFCPSGYWLRETDTSPSSTLEHRLGYYYIQEAASMLPAELFDLEEIEHPLILDMAASPGGKTIHLADRSNDRGFIVANDASRGRINALRIVLGNWGAINQAITCLPGEYFGAAYPERFDAVLLDAPCSMQGLRASESHKARSITLNEVETLAQRQTRLLESALGAAKVGGQVVYSTCTLTPQEDEGVLAALLEAYPGCFEIVDVHRRLPKPAPGLTKTDERDLPLEVQNAVRLWPHIYGTAGFFAAKLVKTGRLPAAPNSFRPNTTRAPKLLFPKDDEIRGIVNFLSDLHGFNLATLMQSQSLQMVEIKGQLYLIGEALTRDMHDLPWLSSGMPLGKALPGGWQPSHEFVSRFGEQFNKGVLVLGEEYLPAWERGEDMRGYQASEGLLGKVVAVRDESGRNLGRGKVIARRLKNLLPTRIF
jgi:16S rRNA (cytosine1407-C5)-methyltransferase